MKMKDMLSQIGLGKNLPRLMIVSLLILLSVFPIQHQVSYPKIVVHLSNQFTEATNIWTPSRSKQYAYRYMQAHYPYWNSRDWSALKNLWHRESKWNHKADNKHSTAFGIPQLLKLSPATPAPRQVARGLAYIKHRYGSPKEAYDHFLKHNWY